MSRPYLKSMPSTESHRAARSPRYDIQPKYYSNRAHQCRYPVLVHNIPKSVCWQELKDFGRLAGGHVAYCDLNRNKNGSGFIEYLFPEDAEDAIRQLNGKRLGGRIITVSAYSRTPRRRSRSRSPIRRSHQISARDEPRKCVFPAAASTYALQRSPRSQDGFPSLYYDGPALPAVLHPDLYTFSGAVESYQTRHFYDTVAQGSVVLQTSSSIDSNEPVKFSVAEPIVTYDYHDFDAYLRLSYDRRLHGCYS